jgi:hypothetical protein
MRQQEDIAQIDSELLIKMVQAPMPFSGKGTDAFFICGSLLAHAGTCCQRANGMVVYYA